MRQIHLRFFPGGTGSHEGILRNMYAEEEDTIKERKCQAWWVCAVRLTKENQNSPTKAYRLHKGIK